jgi:RNA polymerase sigma factor (TIGR02999 family)
LGALWPPRKPRQTKEFIIRVRLQPNGALSAKISESQGGIIGVMTDVTKILSQIESGDPTAAEQLLPLVYDELRRLAAHRIAREKPGQTLQATALVHEAYLRLVDDESAKHWDSRGHFFSAAAESMRRILVDIARKKKSQKAGGGWLRLELYDGAFPTMTTPDRVVALDEALQKLAVDDADAAKLVELCIFAGCSVEDGGKIMGWSRATSYRNWTYARAFLTAHLAADGTGAMTGRN